MATGDNRIQENNMLQNLIEIAKTDCENGRLEFAEDTLLKAKEINPECVEELLREVQRKIADKRANAAKNSYQKNNKGDSLNGKKNKSTDTNHNEEFIKSNHVSSNVVEGAFENHSVKDNKTEEAEVHAAEKKIKCENLDAQSCLLEAISVKQELNYEVLQNDDNGVRAHKNESKVDVYNNNEGLQDQGTLHEANKKEESTDGASQNKKACEDSQLQETSFENNTVSQNNTDDSSIATVEKAKSAGDDSNASSSNSAESTNERQIMLQNVFFLRAKVLSMAVEVIEFRCTEVVNKETINNSIVEIGINLNEAQNKFISGGLTEADVVLKNAENMYNDINARLKPVTPSKVTEVKKPNIENSVERPKHHHKAHFRGTLEDVKQCITKAEDFLKVGDLDKARKWLLKAERIQSTTDARDLLNKIDEFIDNATREANRVESSQEVHVSKNIKDYRQQDTPNITNNTSENRQSTSHKSESDDILNSILEAETYADVAENALNIEDFERAEKFLALSQSLYNTERSEKLRVRLTVAKDLVKELEAAKLRISKNNTHYETPRVSSNKADEMPGTSNSFRKDEAKTYVEIAENAFKERNIERAEKFLKKSESCFSTERAAKLREQISAAKKVNRENQAGKSRGRKNKNKKTFQVNSSLNKTDERKHDTNSSLPESGKTNISDETKISETSFSTLSLKLEHLMNSKPITEKTAQYQGDTSNSTSAVIEPNISLEVKDTYTNQEAEVLVVIQQSFSAEEMVPIKKFLKFLPNLGLKLMNLEESNRGRQNFIKNQRSPTPKLNILQFEGYMKKAQYAYRDSNLEQAEDFLREASNLQKNKETEDFTKKLAEAKKARKYRAIRNYCFCFLFTSVLSCYAFVFYSLS